VLRGRFDVTEGRASELPIALKAEHATVSHRAALAGALALGGAALVVVGEEPWLIGLGVAALIGSACTAFPLVAAPPD
jgi:hypothetical protein